MQATRGLEGEGGEVKAGAMIIDERLAPMNLAFSGGHGAPKVKCTRWESSMGMRSELFAFIRIFGRFASLRTSHYEAKRSEVEILTFALLRSTSV